MKKQLRKQLLKIATGIFSLSLVFSFAVSGVANSVNDVIADSQTTTLDDIETTLINDTVNSATISTEWKESTGITAMQTPDVLKYHFGHREMIATASTMTFSADQVMVVEFDMMHNNVESANFGFVYGAYGDGETIPAASPILSMEVTEANCLSFYGVNSLFYSTLENESLLNTSTGERPASNRWVAWSLSALTTLYIHADGSQQMYQNGKLVAYVTAEDIAEMDATISRERTVNGQIKAAEITAGELIARSKDRSGYCGFVYRPSEESDGTVDTTKSMDLTLASMKIGYADEFAFDRTTNAQLSSASLAGLTWAIDDSSAISGGGMNPAFVSMDSVGAIISQTGWIQATVGDYGYYTSGATSLTSEAVLPNIDARMGDERYAMLRMRTWLGGLNEGTFSVQFGEYKVEIKQATLGEVDETAKTYYYLRVYDVETALTDMSSGRTYVSLKIYDNALLAVSLWGDTGISVSYGQDGQLSEFTFGTSGSGKSYGNVIIETTSGNVRGFYDDIELYRFTPYEGEDFTGGQYDTDRLTISGTGISADATEQAVKFDTSDDSALILSGGMYSDFTLEFDSRSRADGSAWFGVVLGMKDTSVKYSDSTASNFIYFNKWGAALFVRGTGNNSTGLISQGGTTTTGIGMSDEDGNIPLLYNSSADGLGFSENTKTKSYLEENIHIKIVMQSGVVTCYYQIADQEMRKAFTSINLIDAGYTNGLKVGTYDAFTYGEVGGTLIKVSNS